MSIRSIESIYELSPLTKPYDGDNDSSFSYSETYLQRIWRHVKSGQIDPRTISNGIYQLYNGLRVPSLKGTFNEPIVQDNYNGIKGLIKADYAFTINYRANHRWGQHKIPFMLYKFPTEAKFQVHGTPVDQSFIHTIDFFEQSPHAIACFTGPTFKPNTHLPNNGFYLKDYPITVPFEDTKPSCQRRGAFATSANGELVVLDDQTKWELVRENFPNINSLIGGANYLKNGDEVSIKKQESLNQISYLFQYLNQDRQLNTGFVFTHDSGSRYLINILLNDFTSRMDSSAFLGVELEYGGSCCLIRGQENTRAWGFNDRYDHYLVTL